MESAKLLHYLSNNPQSPDIDILIDRLEQRIANEELGYDSHSQLAIGPYTAFYSRISSTRNQAPLSDLFDMTISEPLPAESADVNQTLHCEDAFFASGLDCDQVQLGATLGGAFNGDGNSVLGTENTNYAETDWTDTTSFEPTSLSMVFNEPWQDLSVNESHNPLLLSSPTASLSPMLPSDVRFLLHHYDSHVISSLCSMPLPQEKAPWRDMHLPSALRAYGELDVLGTSSLARVSLLYSLLSLTCSHLSSLYNSGDSIIAPDSSPTLGFQPISNTQRWRLQAQKFRGIARTAFRKHLESKSSHKEKYKEVLMAAMSLICVGIISGDSWDARLYIRQCEDIIRTAVGAKPRFSKRALQLHRMFAFIRIMEQSTCCHSHDEYIKLIEHNDTIPSEVSMIEEPASHQGGLIFWRSLPAQRSLATSEMQLDLPDDEGFSDIHGASGKLFEMLARANALVHKITARAHDIKSRYVVPEDLLGEAAVLEQFICDWPSDSGDFPNIIGPVDLSINLALDDVDLATDTASEAASTMAKCMQAAFYYALLIYFFREVRNTNPKILQHYVRKVITCLECHQTVKTRCFPSKRIGSIVWPSFIVACEAQGEDWRRRAILCIRHTASAGFRNCETAESVAKELWRRRDTGSATLSWRHVVRQLKVFMLLS